MHCQPSVAVWEALGEAFGGMYCGDALLYWRGLSVLQGGCDRVQ